MNWLACAMVVAGSASAAAWAGEVPRYKLEPGQRLRYEAKRVVRVPSVERNYKVTKNDGTKESQKLKTEPRMESTETATTFTVLKRKDDGSVRVLAEKQETTVVNAKEQGGPSRTLAYFELFPDGTIPPNPSIAYYFDPSDFFPPLPTNERELEGGWTRTTPDGWQITTMKVLGHFEGELNLKRTSRDPWTDAYQRTVSETLAFDLAKGRVKIRRESAKQSYATEATAYTNASLENAETVDGPSLERLAEESDRFFELSAKSDKLQDEMSVSPNAAGLFEQAKALVDSGKAGFQDPRFAKAADELARTLKGMKSYYLESAAERSRLIGQPAPSWELKDLEGKTHSLEEYKGKVVLLDFWYRGCAWCIRSMPQLRQVVEATEGKPVVLLGMNTDENVEDARFVADLIKLNYTTLTGAAEVPEKYGVRGFPTLIVVGPDGRVADVHVGYSTELKGQVMSPIEKALSEGAAGE